jgi:hypothetical protein
MRIGERARFLIWTDRLMAAMPSDAAIVTVCTRLQAQTRPAFAQEVQALVGQVVCTRILEARA